MSEPESYLFNTVMASKRQDSFVVSDGDEIFGVAVLLRLTSVDSAIGCFRVRKVDVRDKVSNMLVQALVKRAQGTRQKFVSCIPGRDGIPADATLAKFSFTKYQTREVFWGSSIVGSSIATSPIENADEALELLAHHKVPAFMVLHYRPVVPSSESVKYTIAHGAVFADSVEEKAGLSLVIESRCLTGESFPPYIIPDYLSNDQLHRFERIGEISLFALDDSCNVLKAACNWLISRGVSTAYVYTSLSPDVGHQLLTQGFTPKGAQVIWGNDLKGPLDAFVS